MKLSEACRLLNTETVCSLDWEEHDDPYYRFIVPRGLYSLLEDIGTWMRNPDIERVEVFPNQIFNPRVAQRVTDRIRSTAVASPTTAPTGERSAALESIFRRSNLSPTSETAAKSAPQRADRDNAEHENEEK
jgi:hypothetical protein